LRSPIRQKWRAEIVGDNSEGPQVDWIGYVNLSPTDAFFLIRNNDD
jgi:hypothetical protein